MFEVSSVIPDRQHTLLYMGFAVFIVGDLSLPNKHAIAESLVVVVNILVISILY